MSKQEMCACARACVRIRKQKEERIYWNITRVVRIDIIFDICKISNNRWIPCATVGATLPSMGETGNCMVVGDGVFLPRPQLSNPLATLVMYLLHRAFLTM